MQVIVYNEKQLGKVITDIYNSFEKNKELNISYEKPFKATTIKQLGFIFGALCKSVKIYYEEKGIEYSLDNIKENFYFAASKINDRLLKIQTRFNGENYKTPKRLSEMSKEETSEFIETSIWLIDNAKCFDGLKLHPSIRYTYILNLGIEEKRSASLFNVPIKDKEYVEYVRKQSCLWCGQPNFSHAHHMRIGNKGGTSIKPPDAYCIPLCPECHSKIHQNGLDDFMRDCHWILKYVDFELFLKMNYMKWRLKK